MWRWLVGLAIAVKLLYTLGLAVWSPTVLPQAALPTQPTVVCKSSAGSIACFEVDAPETSSPQAVQG